MSKPIQAAGKRKRAIARITLTPGKGSVIINNISLKQYGNAMTRARIEEPLILAFNEAKKYDIRVLVSGGGTTSQADAIRLAIGRALAQQSDAVKNVLLEYDRQLLVADVRRKEPTKPNTGGNARSKRQKSYR